MGRQCMDSYFREVRQLILNNKGWVKNANCIFLYCDSICAYFNWSNTGVCNGF